MPEIIDGVTLWGSISYKISMWSHCRLDIALKNIVLLLVVCPGGYRQRLTQISYGQPDQTSLLALDSS